ncbi:DUF6285 domain-containing protein [Bradyrhizobium sp. INPA03-11B]|uniref:DUF6285 domain-containing protein n=1 Tax=Bradyrhizobium sp. INPA03-11B TaxID=418598 RepID=UPI00338F53EC
MQDQPGPHEILTAVAAFLRDVVVPESLPRTAFQARVAANAVDLVRRQILLGPASDEAEKASLARLLGEELSLADANAALAARIADGTLDASTAGVKEHLRKTTLAKLAVDQPTYSGYRAALADAPAAKD